MFRALTVSREYGSGAGTIARLIAGRLRWSLLDEALVREIARSAHVDAKIVERCDERVDSWWHRFNRGGLQAAGIEAGIVPADVQFFDAERVASIAEQVIGNAAASGNCVIVGRGAQCVLQSRTDVFHVFIYAPLDQRIARVRGRMRSTDDVEELIRRTDDERAACVRTYFGCHWKDPHLYSLMISSENGLENTAAIIVDALERVRRTRDTTQPAPQARQSSLVLPRDTVLPHP